MIESQEKAGGESCTPGTELELGENIVDSYGKVRDTQTFRFRNSTLCEGPVQFIHRYKQMKIVYKRLQVKACIYLYIH